MKIYCSTSDIKKYYIPSSPDEGILLRCPICEGKRYRHQMFSFRCKFCIGTGFIDSFQLKEIQENIIWCSNCNGTGLIWMRQNTGIDRNDPFICTRCKGQGWFKDWIEVIIENK